VDSRADDKRWHVWYFNGTSEMKWTIVHAPNPDSVRLKMAGAFGNNNIVIRRIAKVEDD
jgi:Uri superfamily endonuclease